MSVGQRMSADVEEQPAAVARVLDHAALSLVLAAAERRGTDPDRPPGLQKVTRT